MKLRLNKFTEAESLLRETLKTYEKARPEVFDRFWCQSLLGASLAAQKRYAEAEPVLLSSYEGMVAGRASPVNRKTIEEVGQRIARLYQDWAKPDKAAGWWQKLANGPGRPQ